MSVNVLFDPGRERWNRFVGGHPCGTVYQSYEWGEILRGQGWEAQYAWVERNREPIAAALILGKRLPGRVGTLLYSPRGPVVTSDPDGLPALASAIHEVARRRRAIVWRADPAVTEDETPAPLDAAGFRSVPLEWSYWNRPKYEMRLSIAPGEAAVFASLGTKIRTKVRHASKRGVIIEEGSSERDIESFYRLLQDTGLKKRIAVRGFEYFRVLYQVLIKSGMARLFLARHDGMPVAGGITARFGPVATLLYLSNDYTTQRAGWAVQWEMIRWAIAQGCRVYDFGGTGTSYPPQETDKGYGVYQFKQSFGAEIVRWRGYADLVYRPTLYGCFRAVERNLPLAERVLLDWPKQTLYRWRRKTDGRRPESAEVQQDKRSAESG